VPDVPDAGPVVGPGDLDQEILMKALVSTVLLALAAGTGFTSCESIRSKPGVDGTAYSLGHLDAMVNADPKKIVEAAESALKDKDIRVETSAASGVDGKVLARTALDKRIEIVVERKDEETSKLSILIGSFGDEALSREIYSLIKAKL
jgi:hypothetical protein